MYNVTPTVRGFPSREVSAIRRLIRYSSENSSRCGKTRQLHTISFHVSFSLDVPPPSDWSLPCYHGLYYGHEFMSKQQQQLSSWVSNRWRQRRAGDKVEPEKIAGLLQRFFRAHVIGEAEFESTYHVCCCPFNFFEKKHGTLLACKMSTKVEHN